MRKGKTKGSGNIAFGKYRNKKMERKRILKKRTKKITWKAFNT